MDHRSDDLFVVDAKQAVDELAQYGSGATELRLERLIGSLAYFSSVLMSIGLEEEASFASDFSVAIAVMDDGDGRRTARDFAELVSVQLDAIRLQSPIVNSDDQLERLRQRFDPSVAHHSTNIPSDSQVLAQAARTIAAVDEIATRLFQAAALPTTDAVTTADPPSPVAALDTAESLPHRLAFEPDNASDLEDDVLSPSGDGLQDSRDFTPLSEKIADEGQSKTNPQLPLDATEKSSAQTTPDAESSVLEVNQGQPHPDIEPHPVATHQARSLDSGTSDPFGRKRINTVFARALKFAPDLVENDGFFALLEAIDELDQVDLVRLLPESFELTGQRLIRVNVPLAKWLVHELMQIGGGLRLELSSVSSTLIISVHFEQAERCVRMARLAARFAGRLEKGSDPTYYRLILPASSRLLRVIPLKLKGVWVATSWAQYVEVGQDNSRGMLVKLLLGDVPDRIHVEELGSISLGVRFDMPGFLRKRDRYRGAVMLPDGRVLPLLG